MTDSNPHCSSPCSGGGPRPEKVQWQEMFPDELAEARDRFPLCYMPYGLCEPHGPQNAIGLDGLKAHALCVRAAREHGGVVAPPVFWHMAEGSPVNRRFMERVNVAYAESFLTCIPSELFLKTFLYQIRSVIQRGFRSFIAVTGHYGGIEEDMRDVAAAFYRHCGAPHWVIADHQCMYHKDFAGDHAGKCETSQLWALRPELVDISRLPEEDGWTGFASSSKARVASRRTGEHIVASQVASLGDAARRLVACAPTELPSIDMDRTETIWQEYLEDEFALRSFRFKTVEDWDREAQPRLQVHRENRQTYQGRMPPQPWEAETA